MVAPVNERDAHNLGTLTGPMMVLGSDDHVLELLFNFSSIIAFSSSVKCSHHGTEYFNKLSRR